MSLYGEFLKKNAMSQDRFILRSYRISVRVVLQIFFAVMYIYWTKQNLPLTAVKKMNGKCLPRLLTVEKKVFDRIEYSVTVQTLVSYLLGDYDVMILCYEVKI